ncbi:MAG: putative mitochondrial protein, conserved, partial [Pleopsidium flavum]
SAYQQFKQKSIKVMSTVLRPVVRALSAHRLLSTTARLHATPPFYTGPAPPRLPKEDQEIFDRLQQSSTGAFSSPRPNIVVNQSPASSVSDQSSRHQFNQSSQTTGEPISKAEVEIAAVNARIQATGDGEEVHPDVRRGPKPEFEGDRNPKTGETGGPKNEPLRWGGNVDWSYNGRVTDF